MLGGARDATEVGEVERGQGFGSDVSGSEPEVGGQFGGIHDLARVEESLRIERPLDLAKGLVELSPEHAFLERGPHQAISVFSAECSAEFEHQVGHLAGDGGESADADIALEVDDRADVQQAD